ncbi:DUF3098 domain-containing protein [Hymenobacter latericus]|uniref:DUF3098 domain-containing protein n=1 Tax=Hymenobacter sp. YIM 151858-1 TaxID=2987688 RepID=UPI0022276722|nr:DUF3098 domain-containing protein [Hymenobacter sp. YIM 151858-1]UYZ59307.1 DUF3098 domain-containing protein [Hymenobacter sp. YIM 151858-1]
MSSRFAFGPRNYRLMFIGLALLAAGFITMSLDTADYGEGFLGLTLGPLLLAAGFTVEFFAIMAKSSSGAATPTQPANTSATTPNAAPAAPAEPARPTFQRR